MSFMDGPFVFGVSPVLQQMFDVFQVAHLCCLHQGGLSKLVMVVDVGTILEQL